ncbi:MAG: YjbH domain-containing protein [Elusimicrobiota bacterium]
MKVIKRYFLIFFFTFSFLHSQNLEGLSGLFYIPTADIGKDSEVTVGASFVDKKLISFSGYNEDAITPYITVNFLPFIEFSVRITHLLDSIITTQGIGDRTVSIRIRLVEENEYVPSILVGLHDIIGIYGGAEAVRNNALYLALSKHLTISSKIINKVSLHTGYGTDIINAQNHKFIGLFGGISCSFLSFIELIGEYDTIRFNSGVRIALFNKIKLLAGFIDMKKFSGSLSYSFQL